MVILAAPAVLGALFRPGRACRQFFAARGVKAELQTLPDAGDAGAGRCCAPPRASAPNILVAGAFGHPRLQEFIFGGTTRAFLNATDGPSLFLSH